MSPGPGRPRNPGLAARRREEILAAAVCRFAGAGFPKADLDQIAADIGCAKGTLYRYFASKDDLFRAAVDRVMQGLLDALTPPEGMDDPLDQIEHAVRAFLGYFEASPESVELLIQERAEFREREHPTYEDYRQASRERWKRLFEGLMRDGRVRRMPADRVVDLIGDLLYGTIFTNYFACRKPSLEEQAGEILAVLFHGLLTPEETARRRKGRLKQTQKGKF